MTEYRKSKVSVHTAGDGCDELGCRPVVVIDPEDREAVQRLTDLLNHTVGPLSDGMHEALREYANPTPPRPVEPTDPAARVIDSHGDEWALGIDGRWWPLGVGKFPRTWGELNDHFGPLEVRG